MATGITIPGVGHGLVFSVSGTSLANELAGFASVIGAAAAAGTLVVNNVTSGTSVSSAKHALAVHPLATTSGATVNTIYSDSGITSYTVPASGEFTIALVGSPVTLTGSSGGADSIIGAGDVTYDATGSANNVVFADGTNTYVGSATGSGDTITGGSGYDNIITGGGATTVFGGSGYSTITLNDTAGLFSGEVYLGDGNGMVNADGKSDLVVTGVAGQTIFGGASVSGILDVVVENNTSVAGPSGDVITAGSATTTVFDSVGGTSIFGGTGALAFVGGASSTTMSDTIVGSTGSTVIFGAANDSLTFSSATTGSVLTAIAGAGNETLNGANALGGFQFFADTTTGAAVDTTVVGGSGYNTFATGTGIENLVGGTGTNIFTVSEGGAGAHVTIFDFGMGNDSVNFGSLDTSNQSVSGGNLTITLADSTTVEFVGITSLTGHII